MSTPIENAVKSPAQTDRQRRRFCASNNGGIDETLRKAEGALSVRSTQNAAMKKTAKMLALFPPSSPVVQGEATQRALQDYLVYLKSRSIHTQRRYRAVLMRFHDYLAARKLALEKTSPEIVMGFCARQFDQEVDEILRYLAQINSEQPRRRDRHYLSGNPEQIAAKRVNKILVIIKSVLAFLIDEGVVRRCSLRKIAFRPADVRNPEGNQVRLLTEKMHFTSAQWNTFLRAILGAGEIAKNDRIADYFHRWFYIVNVIYWPALRVSEALSHGYHDLHTDDSGRYLLHVVGKGDKPRAIPLSNQCVAIMTTYLKTLNLTLAEARRKKVPLLPLRNVGVKLRDREKVSIKENESLIKGVEAKNRVTRKSKSPGRNAIDSGFAKLQQKLGMPVEMVRSIHALRHSRATHLADTTPILKLMKFLGHSKEETTLIYYHSDDNSYFD